MTRRVILSATKKITEVAAGNISAQFTVNVFANLIKHADNSSIELSDIILQSLNEISITDALWSGVFVATDYTGKTKDGFQCTYQMLQALENNPNDFLQGTLKGGVECFITFGTSFALKSSQNSNIAKKLREALQNESSFNFISKKLLQIMGTEYYNEFMNTLLEEGIKKPADVIWAK